MHAPAVGPRFDPVGPQLDPAEHAFAFEYATRGLVTAPGSLPAPEWLAWVAYWTWPLNLLGLALLLLLFVTPPFLLIRNRVVAGLVSVGLLVAYVGVGSIVLRVLDRRRR